MRKNKSGMSFAVQFALPRKLIVLSILCFGLLAGCGDDAENHARRVIVLGFDGMDPKLCEKLMGQGKLPNLSRLAKQGSYRRLGTSTPPQSPVAWSNLITGTDSGRHGVFDFVHRDPATVAPFSSAATEEPPSPLPMLGNKWDSVSVIGYELPLRTPHMKTNRHAPAFWEHLNEAGVPAHIFRMPANYPPTGSKGAHFCCLSDMGTPDIVNTLGTFTYYTEDPNERYMPMSAGGGQVVPIFMSEHRAKAKFIGPVNTFKTTLGKAETVEQPFFIYRDPTAAVVTVEYNGRTILLAEGEWSDWQAVSFEMIPHAVALNGIVRLYLKSVHPYVRLYVSPINFDPREEMYEIDQPADWSVTVSNAVGRYYTQGLPEDTKALSNKVLSREEFLTQAELIFQERSDLFDFAMDHYQGGLFFFYFGSTDQIGHMFWGARQPGHPALTAEEHKKYASLMDEWYERMDVVVGRVMERFPDALLMVMSDHGFGSFRRRFNINTWLKQNGFAAMRNVFDPAAPMNFDFAKTRAYALGINALYVNLTGRERAGIVPKTDKRAVMSEVREKLIAYRDPETGEQVVKDVYFCSDIFKGPLVKVGPDMIIGYASGYQGGGALGEFPKEIMEDNTDAWCGDHCVAPDLVPGVLFASRSVGVDDPSLLDIAPTLLSAFDVKTPEIMQGRDLFLVTEGSVP